MLDALRARRCHGMPFPDGISEDMFVQLAKVEDTIFSFLTQPQNIARLGYVSACLCLIVCSGVLNETDDSRYPIMICVMCVFVYVGRIGSLVRDMFTNMIDTMRGAPGPKFRLYSGHDTSVGPFMVQCGKTHC